MSKEKHVDVEVRLSTTGFLKKWGQITRRDILSVAPLVTGLAGLVLTVIDALGFIVLPADTPKNTIIIAASVILIASYTNSWRRAEQDQRHNTLLSQMDSFVHNADIRQVGSQEISVLLQSELAHSHSWWFRGGSGRWLRKDTLPTLALKNGDDINVAIQILDPRDEELCRRYANYRYKQRDLSDRRPNEFDPRTIQADLLASILAAAVHSAHSRINPEVVLLRTYSPLRIDMGENALLATVASKTAPALFARRGTFLYQSIKDEIQNARHGNHLLVLPENLSRIPVKELVTAADAKRLLSECSVTMSLSPSEPLLKDYAKPELLDFEEIRKRAFDVRDGI
jgi:hypothetical protein